MVVQIVEVVGGAQSAIFQEREAHAIAGGEDDDVDVRRRRAVVKLHPGGGEARHVRFDHYRPADHPVWQLVVDDGVFGGVWRRGAQRVADVIKLGVEVRRQYPVEEATRAELSDGENDTTQRE